MDAKWVLLGAHCIDAALTCAKEHRFEDAGKLLLLGHLCNEYHYERKRKQNA